MLHLSPRLQAIADLLLPGKVLADIGTDHAYIPSYAVMAGLVPRAIASDINRDPVRAAGETVRKLGLADQIDIRLGSGLQVLSVGEVDQIVIAGMGGNTICAIVDEEPGVAGLALRLILQPMIRVAETRRWFTEHGYAIVDERMASEGHHLYSVLAVAPGQQALTPMECEYGPTLIARRTPLLKTLLLRDFEKTEQIIASLRQSVKFGDKQAPFYQRRERIRDLLKQWNE